MENKNYLLVARSRDGYIHEKVNVFCQAEEAVQIIKSIMNTSPRLVRGEIINGNRTHIGDFSVSPFLFVYRSESGEYSTETSRR